MRQLEEYELEVILDCLKNSWDIYEINRSKEETRVYLIDEFEKLKSKWGVSGFSSNPQKSKISGKIETKSQLENPQQKNKWRK